MPDSGKEKAASIFRHALGEREEKEIYVRRRDGARYTARGERGGKGDLKRTFPIPVLRYLWREKKKKREKEARRGFLFMMASQGKGCKPPQR